MNHGIKTHLLPLSLIALMAGCSTTHEKKVGESTNDLAAGMMSSALQRVDAQLQGKSATDLLLNMEKGELLRIDSRYASSLENFEVADGHIREWEDKAKSMISKGGEQIGATLLGDSIRSYEGQDYEKVMVSTRLVMNRLALGDLDNARVDIRRTHEREALIAELREKQLAKSEEEAEKKGLEIKQKDISGYPVEIFDDPEVTKLKNGYQNAFSHYMAGFIYEALNEPSLASPGYRKAIELRGDTKVLEEGLKYLQQRGRDISKGKKTDVLFLVETGISPARHSQRLVLPVPTPNGLVTLSTAFPVIRANTNPLNLTSIDVNGKQVATGLTADFNVMARRALRDELPGMLARASIRLVAKAVLQNEINRQAGPLAGAFAAIASAAIEPDADDRMWRTLPERIYLARTTLAHGKATLQIPGRQSNSFEVRGQRMIVPVRVFDNFTYYGTPIYVGEKHVDPAPVQPDAPAAKGA